MPIEALLVSVIVLLGLALVICAVVIARMSRGSSAMPPILDQRLVAIEGAITRSDAVVREEFGRGRDETRESSRSLREEITGQFGPLANSVRDSIGDLATGQNTRLAEFNERLDRA